MKKCFTLIQWCSCLLFLAVLNSCEKKTDNTVYDKPAAYAQLEQGKYIIYRLDSLRFVNYGLDELIVSYQAKDVVEGVTTDQLGRQAWRVQRYLRDINSTNEDDWKANIDYEIVPGDNYLEVYENNLRFIKLQSPMKEGFSWTGNGYLPDEPFNQYEFTAAMNIHLWDYTYEEAGISVELNGKNYDSTVTVSQIQDSSNVPILNPDMIAQKTVWVEKYAKNIGLIYKEVAIWEYQPPVTSDGQRVGFGIRLTILDHN